MSFTAREYQDIVRDLLTTLTGGTIAEAHSVPLEGIGDVPLIQAPVRTVSYIEGEIEVGEGRQKVRFTERDFEVVASPDNPRELVAIRFRARAKKPAPGSTLIVNYYPLRTKPTPLNDVTVGSVVRTLLETVAREMATQYQQLERVYDSGFVETARDSSLENVAALVGVRRLAAGHPVGKVRFVRRAGSPGAIFIPINTAVTDGDGNRYLTSNDGRMQPGQANLEVWVQGELASTKQLEAGKLTVLERALAGIENVTNDEPTFRAVEDETDEQLRARARRAIHGTGKGTLDAIRFGIESLPFVSAVQLVEQPLGVPGTLRVDVALREDNALNRAQVQRRVEELRPAGIAVETSFAGRIELAFKVDFELADSAVPASELEDVRSGVRSRIAALVTPLAPGATLRRARVIAAVLDDARLVDAKIEISVGGAKNGNDAITLPADRAPRLDAENDVTFGSSGAGAAASGPTVIAVDVELQVELLDRATTVQSVKTLVTEIVSKFLGNLSAGKQLSFENVQTQLRSKSGFALAPDQCLVALEVEPGRFVELRLGSEPFTLAPGATLQLRNVEVVEVKR